MSSFSPDRNHPRYWLPLRRVVAQSKRSSRLPTIATCEFMLMGGHHLEDGTTVWLYKHIWTRRYLNLDEESNAYRYVPPRDLDSGNDGTYVPMGSLRSAIIRLELDEVSPETRDSYLNCPECRAEEQEANPTHYPT